MPPPPLAVEDDEASALLVEDEANRPPGMDILKVCPSFRE
jgi:hypothetical protein